LLIQKKEIINDIEVKVTIHIPDDVKNRQQKVNQIYDILKPKAV
jgi:hypothetical protein